MKPENKKERELIEAEDWLRRVIPQHDAGEIERAKLLAGIAVSQEWLSARLDDSAPPGFLERIKDGVALEAARCRASAGLDTITLDPRSRGRYRWAVGVLAAAAALTFAFVGLRDHELTAETYTASIALTDFRDDPLGESVAMLADEIDDFLLMGTVCDGSDLFDETLEELSGMLADIEDDDWS